MGDPRPLEPFVERQGEPGGCRIALGARPPVERPPPEIEIACYRVMQEAVTNALRHAAARLIQVRLARVGEWLELTVRDDGCGFDPIAARRRALAGHSVGLLGMKERTTLTGGRIEWVSRPGQGCTVTARFPRQVLPA